MFQAQIVNQCHQNIGKIKSLKEKKTQCSCNLTSHEGIATRLSFRDGLAPWQRTEVASA